MEKFKKYSMEIFFNGILNNENQTKKSKKTGFWGVGSLPKESKNKIGGNMKRVIIFLTIFCSVVLAENPSGIGLLNKMLDIMNQENAKQ